MEECVGSGLLEGGLAIGFNDRLKVGLLLVTGVVCVDQGLHGFNDRLGIVKMWDELGDDVVLLGELIDVDGLMVCRQGRGDEIGERKGAGFDQPTAEQVPLGFGDIEDDHHGTLMGEDLERCGARDGKGEVRLLQDVGGFVDAEGEVVGDLK